MCEDCYTIDSVVFECFHEWYDVECSTTKCLVMFADTASCTSKGYDWPCKKSNCNTKDAPGDDPEVVQFVLSGYGVSCEGGPVEPILWFETWYGCYDDCFSDSRHWISCETSPGNCLDGNTDYEGEKGYKKICGCD